MKENQKIFAIGHFKTGTSSYSKAVGMLGKKDLHFPPRYVAHLNATGRVDWNPGYWSYPFENGASTWVLRSWDSMSNVNEVEYEELDREYPGCLFVLTIRNVEEWLVSIRNHMSKRWGAHLTNLFNGRFQKIFGCDCNEEHFDEGAFRQTFIHHHEAVRDYFSGSEAKRLLVLALEDNNKMERLSKFVGLDSIPYPKTNVTGSGGYGIRIRAGKPGQSVFLGSGGMVSPRDYDEAI